jgi:hypothetical protein
MIETDEGRSERRAAQGDGSLLVECLVGRRSPIVLNRETPFTRLCATIFAPASLNAMPPVMVEMVMAHQVLDRFVGDL